MEQSVKTVASSGICALNHAFKLSLVQSFKPSRKGYFLCTGTGASLVPSLLGFDILLCLEFLFTPSGRDAEVLSLLLMLLSGLVFRRSEGSSRSLLLLSGWSSEGPRAVRARRHGRETK